MACKNQNVGSDIWKNSATSLEEKEGLPVDYNQYNLQEESFYSILREAGDNEKTSVRLSVPDPEGNYHEFIVWKSIVANKALVEKYPKLQTYQGISVLSTAVKIRIENSDRGLQAMIFGGKDTWYIVPVPEVTDNYLVYYKKDIPSGTKSIWSDIVIQDN